jgi:hypothetical protein
LIGAKESLFLFLVLGVFFRLGPVTSLKIFFKALVKKKHRVNKNSKKKRRKKKEGKKFSIEKGKNGKRTYSSLENLWNKFVRFLIYSPLIKYHIITYFLMSHSRISLLNLGDFSLLYSTPS